MRTGAVHQVHRFVVRCTRLGGVARSTGRIIDSAWTAILPGIRWVDDGDEISEVGGRGEGFSGNFRESGASDGAVAMRVHWSRFATVTPILDLRDFERACLLVSVHIPA